MNDSKQLKANTLSEREAQIVEQVTLGKSNKAIAASIFIAEKTVKFHLTNIYRKLGVKSRAQLIVLEINKKYPPPVEAPVAKDGDKLPVGEVTEKTGAGVRTRVA